MILGLFKPNPEREARRLDRDARTILDMARQTYRPNLLFDIARQTRDGLAQLEELAGDDRDRRARALERVQALHREARRHHNQVGLTAHTLVIIHGRSLELGELGQPARDAIREFLEEWPAEKAEDGMLPG